MCNIFRTLAALALLFHAVNALPGPETWEEAKVAAIEDFSRCNTTQMTMVGLQVIPILLPQPPGIPPILVPPASVSSELDSVVTATATVVVNVPPPAPSHERDLSRDESSGDSDRGSLFVRSAESTLDTAIEWPTLQILSRDLESDTSGSTSNESRSDLIKPRPPFFVPLPGQLTYETRVPLLVHLENGTLLDLQNRQGYISEDFRLTFENPPKSNALVVDGFEFCNGSLRLSSSFGFFECTKYNKTDLYDRPWTETCKPVELKSVPLPFKM